MNALLLLGIISFGAVANAADLSIAGLHLGEPVPLTPCENPGSSIVIVSRFVCTTAVRRFDGDYWRATIVLPYDQVPAVIASGRVTAYAKGNDLVGVDIQTSGVSTQAMVLRTLTAKYGAPRTQSTAPRQNSLGATFDVIVATWAQADGPTVRFFGAIGRVDAGLISIDLPAAAAARDAERAYLDRVAPRPPL